MQINTFTMGLLTSAFHTVEGMCDGVLAACGVSLLSLTWYGQAELVIQSLESTF